MVKALTQSDKRDKVRVELHKAISQKVKATARCTDSQDPTRSEGGFGGDMEEATVRFVFTFLSQPTEIRMVDEWHVNLSW